MRGMLLFGLCLIAVLGLAMSCSGQKPEPSVAVPPATQEPSTRATEVPYPTPGVSTPTTARPSPAASAAIPTPETPRILLGPEEVPAAGVAQDHLIYATQAGQDVRVLDRDLITNEESTVLQYQDPESTAPWQRATPRAVLSPDGQRLAYTGGGQLKVRVLSTGEETVLAQATPPDDDLRQYVSEIWPLAGRRFSSLTLTSWSPDGRFITLHGGVTRSDVTLMILIDVETGNACAPTDAPEGARGVTDSTWASSGSTMLASSGGLLYGPGLFLVDEADPCNARDLYPDLDARLRSALGSACPHDPAIDVVDGVLSPDASLAALTYRAFSPDSRPEFASYCRTRTDAAGVMFAWADGSRFESVDDAGLNRRPFFSQDGEALYYLKVTGYGTSLWKYGLDDRERRAILELPSFYAYEPLWWTAEGFLAVAAYGVSDPYEEWGQPTPMSRLLVLDVEQAGVRYATSGQYNARFLGLVD